MGAGRGQVILDNVTDETEAMANESGLIFNPSEIISQCVLKTVTENHLSLTVVVLNICVIKVDELNRLGCSIEMAVAEEMVNKICSVGQLHKMN